MLILRVQSHFMVLTFQKCTIQQLETLVQISKETFSTAFAADNNPEDFAQYIQTAFNSEKLASQLKNPNSSFFLVYQEEDLVGYFKLNEGAAQTEFQKRDEMELERIYVLEAYQGNKIGFWMLQEIK